MDGGSGWQFNMPAHAQGFEETKSVPMTETLRGDHLLPPCVSVETEFVGGDLLSNNQQGGQ